MIPDSQASKRFLTLITKHPEERNLEFKVVQILGKQGHQIVYGNVIENSTDLDLAPAFCRGNIKNDGCANIVWPEDGHHFCGMNHWFDFTRELSKVWNEAAAIFGKTDKLDWMFEEKEVQQISSGIGYFANDENVNGEKH